MRRRKYKKVKKTSFLACLKESYLLGSPFLICLILGVPSFLMSFLLDTDTQNLAAGFGAFLVMLGLVPLIPAISNYILLKIFE